MDRLICCDGLDSAKQAIEQGASSILLCSDLPSGGITPTYPEMLEAVKIGLPVNVLVRPRTGNYVYSISEAERIMHEIAFCGNIGLHGVAIGALTPSGQIDLALCSEMVYMARSYGLSLSFHWAIDEALSAISSPKEANALLSDVLSLGISRILTTKGIPTPLEEISVIKVQL